MHEMNYYYHVHALVYTHTTDSFVSARVQEFPTQKCVGGVVPIFPLSGFLATVDPMNPIPPMI